jgi:predicted anti-sigma-YlaC factor YlaD
MTVTRQVIRDLWPLYVAGEASEDTRRLVDEHLAQDAELAGALRAEAEQTAPATLDLPPDHEARTLARVKARLRRRSPFRLLALAFTGLAVLRLMQQATFDTSPTEVIGLAIAAAITWTLHGWHTRFILHGGLPKHVR